MRIFIYDSEGVESAPVVHGDELLAQFFYLSRGLDLLLEDLDQGVLELVGEQAAALGGASAAHAVVVMKHG